MKPINCTTEEVRAFLDGRKTQMRRVIEPQPIAKFCEWKTNPQFESVYWKNMYYGGYPNLIKDCPLGKVGDRLWVRETWCDCPAMWHHSGGKICYKADGESTQPNCTTIRKWQSSVYMPRQFSRITLEITDKRVERLQEINGDGYIKEGASLEKLRKFMYDENLMRIWFKDLWNSTHKKEDRWENNPFVWVRSLKRITQ